MGNPVLDSGERSQERLGNQGVEQVGQNFCLFFSARNAGCFGGEFFPVVPLADGDLHCLDHGADVACGSSGGSDFGKIADAFELLAEVVQRDAVEPGECRSDGAEHGGEASRGDRRNERFLEKGLVCHRGSGLLQAIAARGEQLNQIFRSRFAVAFESGLESFDQAKACSIGARLVSGGSGQGGAHLGEVGKMNIEGTYGAERTTEMAGQLVPEPDGLRGGSFRLVPIEPGADLGL